MTQYSDTNDLSQPDFMEGLEGALPPNSMEDVYLEGWEGVPTTNSIDEYLERLEEVLPTTAPGNKYHWVNRASMFHIHRMLQLKGRPECASRPPYMPDARYMMYRHHCLQVPAGGRWYEFLVEYDIYHPSHGIYFGCKVVTSPTADHIAEIKLAIEDWERIRPITLLRLNNVFPDKDFSHRFRLTDNDEDHTFWPFWIQLYEDEDIVDVGLRALKVIASVYTEYFEGYLPLSPNQEALEPKQLPPVRTAFTDDSHVELNKALEKLVKEAPEAGLTRAGEDVVTIFHNYLQKAQEAGWIFQSTSYEYAWMLSGEMRDVDFFAMVQNIISQVCHNLDIRKIKVPWGALLRVFLRADGTAMKEQIRTLRPKAEVMKLWKARISSLLL